jgi:hypothetical protein
MTYRQALWDSVTALFTVLIMVMCSAFYVDWFVDRLETSLRAQNYGRVLAVVLAGCGAVALLHLVVGAARFIFVDSRTMEK